MGLDMELEFKKYCTVEGSPKTVLPPLIHRSKVEKRSIKGNPNCTNDSLTIEENFKQINFHRYRSSCCRNVPSRTSGVERNEVLKRGSVYQSSREVRMMNKSKDVECRAKIELSGSHAIAFSFGIVDSLCTCDEDSVVSSEVLLETPLESNSIEQVSADGFIDPFTKSKSQRSPLDSASGSIGLPPARPSSIKRSKTLQKSLLNDFSNISPNLELSPRSVTKDVCNPAVSCSPAYLHGYIKFENKQGVPFFELSLKFPEDVFVARRWKAENALNWVYTFHNLHNRRKSKASGWGLKDLNKESSILGQMQVSCYLCAELNDAGDFDNSMVTEFVLYDVARAILSDAAQGNLNQSPDVSKPSKVSNQNSVGGNCDLDNVADELHPCLEIAAIVIEVPFGKRESLKHKGGDTMDDQPHPNLLDLSSGKQRKEGKEGIFNGSRPTEVNVVTTSENHSLGSNENCGPSPLLDRWRLGGGCECGGWDMGCPLTVFRNSTIRSAESIQPLELFIQGAKENTPALTMNVNEEGRYSVDFHAQLSSLQAFSICVAILHCSEASAAVMWERDKQSLQCNSLSVFIEEEFKTLIEAVAEDEERKVRKNVKEMTHSFKLNPLFSPIARV